MRQLRATLIVCALLAGCAAPAPPPAPPPPPPPPTAPAGPRGLAEVLGLNAAAIQQKLGTPSLNRTEGPNRLLQYKGAACVLNLFLAAPSGEALARFADARGPDGRAIDANACVNQLIVARSGAPTPVNRP
jgi:hypothetical protein